MGEAAEAAQIVKVTIDGLELAFKVGAVPFKLLFKLIRYLVIDVDFKKKKGKTSMAKIMKRAQQNGEEVQVCSVDDKDWPAVEKALKKNGVLYSELADLNLSDGKHQFAVTSSQVNVITAILKALCGDRMQWMTMDDYVKTGDLDVASKKMVDEMERDGVHTTIKSEDFDLSEEDKEEMMGFMNQAIVEGVKTGQLSNRDMKDIAGDKSEQLRDALITCGILPKELLKKEGKFFAYPFKLTPEEAKERLANYGDMFRNANEKSKEMMGDYIQAASNFATKNGYISRDELAKMSSPSLADKLEKYLVTAGIISDKTVVVNGQEVHKTLMTAEEAKKRLTAYGDYAQTAKVMEYARENGLIPISINISEKNSLLQKEEEDRVLYRVPGTKGQDFIWIQEDDMTVINSGKGILSYLDPKKDYTLYDSTGKSERRKVNGRDLYSNHYDPVERKTNKKYNKEVKKYKNQQKQQNEKMMNHNYSAEELSDLEKLMLKRERGAEGATKKK